MVPGVDGLEVGRLERGGVVVSPSSPVVDGVVSVGDLHPAGDQVGRHQRRVRVLHLKSRWGSRKISILSLTYVK